MESQLLALARGKRGGGNFDVKSDEGARLTFQGLKFVHWYCLGC